MLFIRHAVQVKAQVQPCGIILFAADHDLPFLDEQVPVFVFDEVLLIIKAAELFPDHGLERFVPGADPRDEADPALMVFIVKQIQVVPGDVSRVQDAGGNIDSE